MAQADQFAGQLPGQRVGLGLVAVGINQNRNRGCFYKSDLLP
jgi:hypothetical protein